MIPKLTVVSGVAMFAGGAMAQVPPDIAAALSEAGRSMDPSTGKLYAPLFADEDFNGIEITHDLAYGKDPMQVLDIYVPSEAAQQPRPVLVFVHGGGFTRGDKHGAFYPDNITAWAARQGMLGVNINYRLAPGHSWPAGAGDLADALAWVRSHVAQYGGDSDRIILWGHSAGANHVADYIGHGEERWPEDAGVKGAVLLSPFYAPEPGEAPHVYYGADTGLQTASAAIDRLGRSGVPLFIGYAELDPEAMRQFARTAIEKLCADGTGSCPASIELSDHNHFTEGVAVGTADTSLSGPVLRWIESLD